MSSTINGIADEMKFKSSHKSYHMDFIEVWRKWKKEKLLK
jgi:hypothetical protein